MLNPVALFHSASSRSSSSRFFLASSSSREDPYESNSDYSEESSMTSGSHQCTLDRLYAWEKKLYKEVKVTIPLCSILLLWVLKQTTRNRKLSNYLKTSNFKINFMFMCFYFNSILTYLWIFSHLVILVVNRSFVAISVHVHNIAWSRACAVWRTHKSGIWEEMQATQEPGHDWRRAFFSFQNKSSNKRSPYEAKSFNTNS